MAVRTLRMPLRIRCCVTAAQARCRRDAAADAALQRARTHRRRPAAADGEAAQPSVVLGPRL
eukprot:1682464-Pleurochrysis_carterae.AAC.2